MSKKKERPEGWIPLLSLAPGEVAIVEFHQWTHAVEFMKLNGVVMSQTRQHIRYGEDPTVLTETGHVRRGTWSYLTLQRRQNEVKVFLDDRWKSLLELGCTAECAPKHSTVARNPLL